MNFLNVLVKYTVLMGVSGILLLFATFCTGKNSSAKDENYFICGKESPQWFKDEVKKIADDSHIFKPIKVYLIKDNETEYIAIEDHRKSSTEKIKVFMCCGTQIQPKEERYALIYNKYANKEAKIIWPE